MQSKRKNVDKRKIFLWCAAAGIVLCAVLFCLWHNRTALAEQRVERALSVTVSQPEPRLAQEDNTETGAWITVPGTNIDAPVQQASDNDYYLRRDTAGNADVHGCVFADYACDLNSTSLSRNLVLYGHTFEDGYEGGFKALHNYEQDSFAEEHPYIYLSLPDAALTYRVVSAGVCSAADDRDCIEPNPDDAAFAQILAKAAARNTLDNGESWGILSNGRFLTAQISVYRRQESACTLSDILMNDVEEKYFLSPREQALLLYSPGQPKPPRRSNARPKKATRPPASATAST